MPALATLSVDLTAQLARFEGDMGKAARASEKASADIVRSLGQVKGALVAMAAGFSFSAIIDMGRATLNSVDALNDLKDATGASIENISALEDVAARTGTNFETVQTSLIKFNAALKDAKPDSDTAAAFKALHLNLKELQGLDPAEALLKTATALAGFADDGNKARLTQELFGKSLKEVAPFLKDLAEKGQLVATVTTEQAEAAERFNKQLFAMQKNSEDARRALTIDLVTGINAAADAFRSSGLLAALQTFMTGTEAFKNDKKLVGLTEELVASQKLLDESRMIDANMRGGIVSMRTTVTERRINEIKEEIKLIQGYKKVLTEFGAPVAATAPAKATVGALPNKPKPEHISDQQRELASYVKTLESQLSTDLKLTETEKSLNMLKSLGTLGEIPQVRELVLNLAQQTDELKAQAEAYKLIDSARKSADQYVASLAKETQAMEENNRKLAEHVQEIGLTTVQVNALTLARLDSAIASAEQERAQLNLQNSSEAEIASMERKIELLKQQRSLTATGQIAQTAADDKANADKASKDFADGVHNDLKGAFSAAFRDSSGEPLKAFGNAIANVLYSRAATALTDSLLGGLGGTGKDSFFGKIFAFASFDGGGYTGPGSRVGGMDGRGGFMAMLHPNETVVDHTKGQSAGGTTVINNNFTVGDVASVSMVRQALAANQRQMMGALQRSQTYS